METKQQRCIVKNTSCPVCLFSASHSLSLILSVLFSSHLLISLLFSSILFSSTLLLSLLFSPLLSLHSETRCTRLAAAVRARLSKLRHRKTSPLSRRRYSLTRATQTKETSVFLLLFSSAAAERARPSRLCSRFGVGLRCFCRGVLLLRTFVSFGAAAANGGRGSDEER